MADPNATVVQPQPPAENAPAPASNPDRYELLDELARGGMGVVYRARDRVLNRVVGLKTLISLEPAEAVVQRFRAEAHISGQLQHPNIPPVHDLGTLPDGRPFLAMKLIKGDTLDALLKARPDPAHDRGRFVAVFEHIAQGVAYAHAHNVIHRDLKPLNVMVGAFGEVQVMDWGLAKVLGARPAAEATEADTLPPTVVSAPGDDSDGTRAGSVLGTPTYMPREQAIGAIDQVDARSDVFSLGGILCAILTGKPPYVGNDSETTRQLAAVAKLDDAFARLSACGAEPELVALCKRCLSAEKADRPADAGAVARAVAEFRAEAERRARQAELDRVRLAEQRKRARVQLALAGALALLLAAGGAFAWWRDNQLADRALAEEQAAAEQLRLDGERRAATARADAEAEFKARQARQGIDANLKLSTDPRKQYKFEQAEAALSQAAELARGGAPERSAEVERAQRELAFVVKLDDIRYRKWIWLEVAGGKGTFNEQIAAPEYRAAFAGFGLDAAALDPAEVAARVAASGVRAELVAALDDWALYEPEAALAARLLEAVRLTDPGPWHDRLRDPNVRANKAALAQLATDADVRRVPPPALTVLATLMRRRGLDPVPLLVRARGTNPDDFELAFQLGTSLGATRASGEQIGPYEAARALRPTNTAVLNNLGNGLSAKGDFEGALALFRRAIELDPRSAQAHNNLSNVLHETGDLDGGLAAVRRAIELDPKFALAHSNLGATLRDKGDLAGALAAVRRAIELDPNLPSAHGVLGNVLRAKGDLDGAITAYRRAIELDPKYAPGFVNLGTALRNTNDRDGALAAFRRAIELDPKHPGAHNNLGAALCDKGNIEGALPVLRRAIELDPKYAPAHNNLGNVLRAKGDLDGAITAYHRAIELNPKDALAHSNLGYALRGTKDLGGAIAAYRRAIELNPKDALTHNNLGVALRAKGDLDGAITAYRRAIELNPKYALAHNSLGVALCDKNDLDGALAAYRRAIEVNPNYAPAHVNAGDVFLRQNKYADCIACARAAIKVDPTYSNAHAILGDALLRTGDIPGARAALTEAARLDKRWAKMLAKLPPLAVAPPPRAK